MSFNQRISPNLSETPSTRQAPACRQAGFTLIELMVVLAILGVLLTIASGDWSNTRDRKQVEAAAAKVRSAMVAARISALANGKTQYVGIDLTKPSVANTLQQATYVGGQWNANTYWEPLEAVQVFESNSNGAKKATQPAIKTFSFRANGVAKTETGSTYTVRFESVNTTVALVKLVTVTNATGRVRIKTCTVAQADANQCK